MRPTYKIILACSLFVLLTGVQNILFSQTKEIEIQQQKVKKLEEDISFLDEQINQTQKKQKNSLDELVLIQNKIGNREALLKELDKQIDIQNLGINKKSKEIKELEQRLDTLDFYFKRLIYNAYKNRNEKVWFMYILSSNSLEQGYRRWSYLRNYSNNISKQVHKINDTKDNILKEQATLRKLKAESLKQSKIRESELNTLQKEEKSSKTLITNLSKKQKEFKRQLTLKKQEAQKLNKEVERMIAKALEEERKRNLAAKDGKNEKENNEHKIEVENNIKLTGSFESNKGKLPWPVKGVVIESFGEHYHPTLKNVKLPFNNGINISAHQGAQVRAVFDGVVKQIVSMPGYNQCILVQHGNYFTFYCKLDNVDVKIGDKVTPNTILGSLVINQNTSTLHFELWEGTNKQNPQHWLIKN